MTTTGDPSDNVTSSSTIQAETVSHVSPTSTTNTIIIAADSGFDQSPDLVIIKLIVISLSMAVMAIVMTTVAVLVAVVAMVWRRRRVNSASTTVVEIESQNNATAEFNMNDNVSYNICDTDVLSHHYEYPDLSMTVLDESNIYDSIDSQ